MTSQHVELAFARAKELTLELARDVSPFLSPNTEVINPGTFATIFDALLQCDDDAQPKDQKVKGASA